jgi:hypothetical protein
LLELALSVFLRGQSIMHHDRGGGCIVEPKSTFGCAHGLALRCP